MIKDRYSIDPSTGLKTREGFVCSSWTRQKHYCVAVRLTDQRAQVRDTKDENDLTLSFNKEEWSAFINGVKAGEFDLKS